MSGLTQPYQVFTKPSVYLAVWHSDSPHPYTYLLSFYDGRVLGKSEPGFHVGVQDCEASHLLDGLIGVRVYKAVCTHVGLAFGQKPLLQHLRNG